MSKKILKKNIGSMSIAVFLSRISGLLRDQIFAYFFGVSFVADAFNFAYTIPNLLRRLFGEGALGAAFIPIYQETGVQKGKKNQIDFAINVLSLLTLFLSFLSILGIVFAPLIIKILTVYLPNIAKNLFSAQNIGSGFDKRTFLLTVKLTRILFPYLFFIGISSTLIAILNSHNKYFIPGLSSALLNISMIAVLFFANLFHLHNSTTLAIILSIGVIIGGFLQVIINFPLLKKIGYTIRFNFSLKENKALKELWTKFLPGVWGIAVRQINLLVDKTLASMLITGSISALNYGNRIMELPLSIFGVAIGTAVIPHFSKNVASKNFDELNEKLSYAVSLIAFIMMPVTVLIFIEGKDYLQILFMRGAFDEKALLMSYNALLFYSLGLIFYAWNRVYTAVFYAMKNTKTPFIIATVTVFFNIGLNLYFMNIFNYKGLALATSVSSLLQFIILLYILRKKYRFLKLFTVITDVVKIAISSLVTFFIIKILSERINGHEFFITFIRATIVSITGLLLFFVLSYILKVKIIRSFINHVPKR